MLMKRIFIKRQILHFTFLINALSLFDNSFSQENIAPGQWFDYLPYKRINKIIPASQWIFCATNNSLFYYNKQDNTINTISKVQGLSDCSIETIGYDENTSTLIIVYDDLNIDLLQNRKIFNFPTIKKKIIPNKKVNNITVFSGKAYLSCGFGIVVFDMNKQIILDTYYLTSGNEFKEVFDVAIDQEYIYASTVDGIYRATSNHPYLADFAQWALIKSINSNLIKYRKLEISEGKLFVWVDHENYQADSVICFHNNQWTTNLIPSDEIRSLTLANNKIVIAGTNIYTVDKTLNYQYVTSNYYSLYAIYDNENNLWISDTYKDLIKIYPDGNREVIAMNSPTFANNSRIDVYDGQIWTVAGLLSPNWLNEYSKKGFARFYENKWESFYSEITPDLADYYDFVNVRINPFKPDEVYIAGWWAGLVKYENGNFIFYNGKNNNSSLKEDMYWPGHTFVYGIDFDAAGNVWVTNSRTLRPLSVRKNDGTWKSFSLPYVNTNSYYVGDILVTSWGHKWITVPRKPVLIIFDDNGTIDDERDDRSLTLNLGDLVSKKVALIDPNRIYSLAEDRDGNIWVGTDAGPVQISAAQYIFDNSSFTSIQKILVNLNVGENIGAYLLENETIYAIAVDGGNRKWMATQNSGVYLISSNNVQVLQNFNKDNSPLFSNTVLDIKIDHKNGNVFFATDKGLISYRGYATKGTDEFGDVYVFPNPVRENYTGDIIVTNLLTDAIVKITDTEGNLVYETRATGGQAQWNGKNLRGQRVKTGVYFIFCSNDDGTKTRVIKLLFIH